MNTLLNLIDWIKSVEREQITNCIIGIVIIAIFFALSPLMSYMIVKIFYRKQEKETIKESNLYKAIKMFFRLFGLYVARKVIELNDIQNQFCDKCFKIVVIWTVARIISGIFETRTIILEKINRQSTVKKNLFMSSLTDIIIKFILYIIAAYLSVKEFGLDVGGLMTGLGLTGAIFALAAQDIVKQVFSGITIFIDRPFEIGDWIEINGIEGTVIDISMKSTRLRTIEDTIVTIPNGSITSENIINWGKIGKRVYRANLKLALETKERTVEKLLSRIRYILKYNEDIIKPSMIIECNKIEDDAINIYLYVETTVTDYRNYQKFCNKINLTLLNILETQGVKLAYPGRNIYMKQDLKQEKGK